MSSTQTNSRPAITQGPLNLKSNYGDWRDDLFTNGYVVIKNAIPKPRALEYQQRAFAWLQSFNTPINITDKSTWKASNFPVQSKLNTFDNFAVVHEKSMWDARLEPGVMNVFRQNLVMSTF